MASTLNALPFLLIALASRRGTPFGGAGGNGGNGFYGCGGGGAGASSTIVPKAGNGGDGLVIITVIS